MKKAKNVIALIIAGISYGSFGIWIRFLGGELTSYQQIFIRNILGFLFSLVFVLILKESLNFKKVNKIHLALYTLSFPITQVFYTFSVLNSKLGVTMFSLFAAAFISSFLIGKVYFSDKTTKQKIISLAFAFVGLTILSYKSFSNGLLNTGFLFGLLSGCFDAVTNAGRRLLSGKVDRFALVSIQMLGGIVVAIILMAVFNQNIPTTMSTTTILVAVVFGILLMVLNILMNYGFKDFDLNLGTIILSTELVAAPIFGFLIFNEVLSTTDILGGAFILSAIVISNIPSIQTRRL